MGPVSRRTAIGIALTGGVGAVAAAVNLAGGHRVPHQRALDDEAAGYDLSAQPPSPSPSPSPSGTPAPRRPPPPWIIHATESGRTVAAENLRPGSTAWTTGPGTGTRPAGDVTGPIQAYTDRTSVNVGETIAFHISVRNRYSYVVDIWRTGYYAGTGARHMATSLRLRGTRGARPSVDPDTRGVTADWKVGIRFEVPEHFLPGLYYATFTNAGYRYTLPFAVTDRKRRADLCVVLPFTTYQAYNMWPADGKVGTSLYRGYAPGGHAAEDLRGSTVSFDRPFMHDGLPFRHEMDTYFVDWAERAGYDLTYATSVDIDARDFDPTRYRGLVFSGHDEYWSDGMRATLDRAIKAGVGAAFLSANNVYWRIRFKPATTPRTDRSIDCYKTDRIDPLAHTAGRTTLWRDYGGGRHAEQATLGSQYVGVCHADSPLTVANAHHWLWAGAGVADGDRIDDLVGVEADGLTPGQPTVKGGTWTLVSDSRFRTAYVDPSGAPEYDTQHSSVWETPYGGVVFNAGTMRWTRALSVEPYLDPRVQQATRNLLGRILTSRPRPPALAVGASPQPMA